MNAVGNSHRIKENGMSGEFRKVFGRIENEEMVVVGLFELHRLGFDQALTLTQGLADNTRGVF